MRPAGWQPSRMKPEERRKSALPWRGARASGEARRASLRLRKGHVLSVPRSEPGPGVEVRGSRIVAHVRKSLQMLELEVESYGLRQMLPGLGSRLPAN